MSDLIERLEKTIEPSRELDVEIAKEVGWRFEGSGKIYAWLHPDGVTREIAPPLYTWVIDSATSLIGTGYEWLRKSPGVMTVYRIPADDKEWAVHYDAKGATPAIALCAAALKARQAVQA